MQLNHEWGLVVEYLHFDDFLWSFLICKNSYRAATLKRCIWPGRVENALKKFLGQDRWSLIQEMSDTAKELIGLHGISVLWALTEGQEQSPHWFPSECTILRRSSGSPKGQWISL